MYWYFKWSLTFTVFTISLSTFLVSPYFPRVPRSAWFETSNKIWWRIQNMMLLIEQYIQPWYFSHFGPNTFPCPQASDTLCVVHFDWESSAHWSIECIHFTWIRLIAIQFSHYFWHIVRVDVDRERLCLWTALIFTALKVPSASACSELVNLGPNVKHATIRPPKVTHFDKLVACIYIFKNITY